VAFGVVLDTCTLYPFSLCDILLRLAERELYDLYWSKRILEELERNLVENRLTKEQAARRVAAMHWTFPAALVPVDAIRRLEGAMTNHEKDRHVLAAAVASRAEAVVTFNRRDFPKEACEPYGIEAVHPDQFLLGLHDLAPPAVEMAIDDQTAALYKPPISRAELTKMLEVAGVPHFAARLRR
jgi:predicted nucleic acid-binding protein